MATTTYGGLLLPDDDNAATKVPTYNTAIDALAGQSFHTIWASAYHNADQSISNITQTALALNSERWDTDVIHDNSTNNSRLTCKTAGVYLIIGTMAYANNTTGVRQAAIRLGGSTFIASVLVNANGGSNLTVLVVTRIYPLAVNEYVELVAFQDSGGSLNVTSAGNYSPEFMMIRLGPNA